MLRLTGGETWWPGGETLRLTESPVRVDDLIDASGLETTTEGLEIDLDERQVIGAVAGTDDGSSLLARDQATRDGGGSISTSDLGLDWSQDGGWSGDGVPIPVAPGGGAGGGNEPYDGGEPDGGLFGGFDDPGQFGWGGHWMGDRHGHTPEVVPLPTPFALGLVGLLGVFLLRRK